MREISIDARTVLAPASGGYVVREVDDARRPSKSRQSLGAYPDEAAALRAVVTSSVLYGQWRRM